MSSNICILGAGPSGLAAGYRLKSNNVPAIIFEKENHEGGLCKPLPIQDFHFDCFVHFSFTLDKEIRQMFDMSSKEIISHKPEAFNYYKGHWLAHPAQNNLYPLSADLKKSIVDSFKNRPKIKNPNNYKEWLEASYGTVFSKEFPTRYTRKYWTVEPECLETSWVGFRILKSDINEIKLGCTNPIPSPKYYTNEMRYPEKGGFYEFIKGWVPKELVKSNHELIAWNLKTKCLSFKDKELYHYDEIISTLPLPYIISIMKDVPVAIQNAAKKLYATSGITISIGLKGDILKPHLWFYLYDEDVQFARVYSPSLKSPHNAPKGYSSLQAEIYYSALKPLTMSKEELIKHTIEKLVLMEVISKDQILFAEANQFEYANVIFTNKTIENREIIRKWLSKKNIICAGRYGTWEYLWSDQSIRSGMDAADSLIKKLK